MEKNLTARPWWAFLIRALVAIAFGIILLAWPAATVYVLLVVFGIFALVDGVIGVIASIVLATRKESWGLVLVSGLLGLLIGGIVLSRPDIALVVVILLIVIWAIVSGIFELIAAFDMPPASGRGLLGAVGVLSIIIGILLISIPLETAWAVIIIIGIYALVAGVGNIVLAFYTKSAQKKLKAA